MMLHPFLVLIMSVCLATSSYAQKIATLEVELIKSVNGLHVPVRFNLNELTFLSDTLLNVVEVQGTKYRYVGPEWRATERWNKDNSEVLTSEGRTRKSASYNHPEPLRREWMAILQCSS